MDSLISAQDLARLLGVSREWVTAKAEASELPGYKLGRSWRFDTNEVTIWLSEQGNPPTRRVESRRQVLPEAGKPARPAPVNLQSALEGEAVAEDLQVSLDRVRTWVRCGMLPGIVSRGVVKVDADAYAQWRIALSAHPTLHKLPPGPTRTGAITNCIQSHLLHRRYPRMTPTPGSARRHGTPIPTWAEVLPSGRS